MFCRVKSNDKVCKEDIVYKFYLCERKRVDGKVKSKDIHIINFDYFDLTEIFDKTGKVILFTTLVKKRLKDKCLYSPENLDLIVDKVLDLRDKLTKEKEEAEEKRREQQREEARKRAEQQEREKREYEEFFKRYNFNQNCSGSSIGQVDDTTKEFMIEIIKAGYKKLASKYHPDKGGKPEDMQKLNEAKEELDKIMN